MYLYSEFKPIRRAASHKRSRLRQPGAGIALRKQIASQTAMAHARDLQPSWLTHRADMSRTSLVGLLTGWTVARLAALLVSTVIGFDG
jgi:hypothetical protein